MAMDGVYVQFAASGGVGPPFYHGVKDPRFMTPVENECTM